MEAYIRYIGKWMTTNKLKLNTEKTELLLIGSQFRHKPTIPDIRNICDDLIQPSESAINIGAIFDRNMDYKKRINVICKTFFFP